MTPAKSYLPRWPLLLGIVAFAVVLKACVDRDPTDSAVSPPPQLAPGVGTLCTSATQSISAPCVEVTVTVGSKGQDQPVEGKVVELYNGGFGSATGAGLVGIDLTDGEGKVAFDLAQYLAEGDAPLGLCAVFKGLNDVNFSVGGSLHVIPNTESNGLEISADYEGRVTDTKKKDGVPLTLETFVDNCINWTDPAAAPISVAYDEVEKVSLKTKASYNLQTACRFPDGAVPDTYCNSWMVLDLTKGIGPDGTTPLCSEDDYQWTCNFWVGTVPYKGIKPGLIVSGDGSQNAAVNWGLVKNANYQGELAFFGGSGEFLTASLKDIVQADGDGKPGGGPPKDGTTTNISASVDMLPTTCVTNELFESDVDGGAGWNIRNPVKYGYFGSAPYSIAIFAPDLEHIAIWFDVTAPAGGFTNPANAYLQLHMRSKPDPYYPDGVGPTTDNIVARYDFLPCLTGGSPIPIDTDDAVMSADCRQVVRTDAFGNTFEAVEVTYVVISDPARLYEFRVEAFEDFTPETARSDDTRAMTLIDKPAADFMCPLKDGTTGVSTDPKWVTPAG